MRLLAMTTGRRIGIYASLVGLLALASVVRAQPTTAQVDTILVSCQPDAGITYSEFTGGGGASNIVTVCNRADGRFKMRGIIQLNRIPGPTFDPDNHAYARGSCTDCQSFSVAMQIDLISPSSTRATPKNIATAVNVECTRCGTVARALQYVITVDDPLHDTPPEVRQLVQTMDRDLTAIAKDPNSSLPGAEAQVDAVIAQFSD